MTTVTTKYLRASELAQRWGTSVKALSQLRYRGVGPEYVKIQYVGVRYPLDAIEEWENGQGVER